VNWVTVVPRTKLPVSKPAPPESSSDPDEFLASEATRIVRVEMVRRGISFRQLADSLERMEGGPVESVQTLINKVNRGRFSLAFFLRVGRAMGMDALDLSPLPAASYERPRVGRPRQRKST